MVSPDLNNFHYVRGKTSSAVIVELLYIHKENLTFFCDQNKIGRNISGFDRVNHLSTDKIKKNETLVFVYRYSAKGSLHFQGKCIMKSRKSLCSTAASKGTNRKDCSTVDLIILTYEQPEKCLKARQWYEFEHICANWELLVLSLRRSKWGPFLW